MFTHRSARTHLAAATTVVGVAAALSEAAGEAAGAEAAGGAREAKLEKAKLGAVTAAEAMWPQRHAAADGSRERSRTPQRAECAWQSLLVRALCGHSFFPVRGAQ